MDNTVLQKKLSGLPENMHAEVADFIDFLLLKASKQQQTSAPDAKPQFGSGKGMFVMHDNFDEPLEDFKDYMH